MNAKTFSGKVALVTAGTSGIGKNTAIEFARAGAKVVLTARREKEGAQEIHLCDVNQFVAAPIDHSSKQEQTRASGFVKVGGIERIAGSLTFSDLTFPASDNAADHRHVRC